MIVDIVLGVSLLILLLLSAFFSGSETALFALDATERHLLRKRQDLPSRRVSLLISELQESLVTILVGNNLVNVLMAVLATRLFIRHLGQELGVALSLPVVTLTVLFCGEILPKNLAVLSPRAFSLRISGTLLGARRLFGPIVRGLQSMNQHLLTWLQRHFPPDDPRFQDKDLIALLEIGLAEGSIVRKELDLARGAFELSDTPVRETMTPRVDLFLMDVDTPLRDASRQLREAGFSRVPVFRESPDRVVGVLEASALLAAPAGTELAQLLRPARFCPESQNVGPLLAELIEEGESQVLILDEYGALEGLATLVDLFEVLVGEILTRRDYVSSRFYMPDENTLVASSRLPVDKAADLLGADFGDASSETIGGLLMERIGEVPSEGDSYKSDGISWTVVDADGPVIKLLRLEKLS